MVRPSSYDQVLRAIARNVRAARLRLGLSQEEAADRAGMAARQWQRVEAGEPMTLRTLVLVSAALEVEIPDVVRR